MKRMCLLVLCVCAASSMATVVYQTDFAATGAEGWGTGVSAGGIMTPNWDHVDSATGSQCVQFYPQAAMDYYFAYRTIVLTPSQQAEGFNAFTIVHDFRDFRSEQVRWMLSVNYTDGTNENVYSNYQYAAVNAPAYAWETKQFDFSLTQNSGRTIGSVLIKFFNYGNLGGGVKANEAARIDNIVLSAIPEPATMALLGLGGLLLRRKR